MRSKKLIVVGKNEGRATSNMSFKIKTTAGRNKITVDQLRFFIVNFPFNRLSTRYWLLKFS